MMPPESSPIRVKICGLRTPESRETALAHGADFLGCVHYPPSPRHCDVETISRLFSPVPETIGKAVVLVDPDDELITRIASTTTATHLQLHGAETPGRVAAIRALSGLAIIKALSIRSADDIAAARAYSNVADMLLFDAKPPRGMPAALPGGNGIAFDWRLLHQHPVALPWFLAGGLSRENIADALRISGARFIDVSSNLESAPGVKDNNAIAAFLDYVHCLSQTASHD